MSIEKNSEVEPTLKLLEKMENKFTPEVLLSIAEIQQSRSNFQIKNFVVNQHDTAEMQYVQTLIELQQLYFTVKTVILQTRKIQCQIDELKKSNNKIDSIEAEIKELELEQTKLSAIGAIRELETLLEIYNSFETKFTRKQIEDAQEKYWTLRLKRQSIFESIGGSPSQASHLEALRQMGQVRITGDSVEFAKMIDER